ncbi:Fur family transcriptional regulator [Tessaracoccus lacteus]|uniref:Fur family transcriptional regulator n=1 Tax=Tessaracoccus lacteus TaxID=3041766 RepID=A0ABY8Q075_9ACTN|nr:Fur family transcriptional regulator [Tessaracoccus sp. T21]WGT47966.1 Fur family transcriptional regulator [Tessaracoccus sp. T21]
MTDWPTLLRDAGLRVTAGRLAVLTELESGDHLGVGEITDAVRSRIGSASTQAVYDVLAALHDAHLIRRVEPAGHSPRYELETSDNHHHLMCRRCGAMRNVACVTGHAPCLSPSETGGFVVDEAELVFWGLCPSCQENTEEKR